MQHDVVLRGRRGWVPDCDLRWRKIDIARVVGQYGNDGGILVGINIIILIICVTCIRVG